MIFAYFPPKLASMSRYAKANTGILCSSFGATSGMSRSWSRDCKSPCPRR
jgi:hypothetical protein